MRRRIRALCVFRPSREGQGKPWPNTNVSAILSPGVSVQSLASQPFEANSPYSITDYSFSSAQVQGATASVDVVFTASSAQGGEQFYRTQHLVREDGGWRVVMRDDQVAAFLGTG